MKINLRYLPKRLSRKDKTSQSKMLMKSRRLYKKGVYYTRKAVPSFHSKKSPHIIKAMKRDILTLKKAAVLFGQKSTGNSSELV